MRLAGHKGAGAAWSLADYNTDANTGTGAIGADEVFINQHWAKGDALVTVPGYPTKILPPSGVLGEACLRMVEAEMLTLLGLDSTHR